MMLDTQYILEQITQLINQAINQSLIELYNYEGVEDANESSTSLVAVHSACFQTPNIPFFLTQEVMYDMNKN